MSKKIWQISKQFDCCYGHRVWTQTLDRGYAVDELCACKHLHGHNMKLIVHLQGEVNDELPSLGMVTDFKHMNWFKEFVNTVLDHRFLIDRNDPIYKTLVPFEDDELEQQNWYGVNTHKTIKPDAILSRGLDIHHNQYYNGFVILDFVPTSENFSKWMLEIINEKMNPFGCKCVQIEFFETPKSRAIYKEID